MFMRMQATTEYIAARFVTNDEWGPYKTHNGAQWHKALLCITKCKH